MSGNTKVLRKCLQITVISCLEGQQNFLVRQESSLNNKKIYIIFIYIYSLVYEVMNDIHFKCYITQKNQLVLFFIFSVLSPETLTKQEITVLLLTSKHKS